MSGAIYVDLDGTLAHYDGWKGPAHIGEPVPAMARRVDRWLEDGMRVVIFTARVWTDGSEERTAEAAYAHRVVSLWVRKHFGTDLMVTCVKGMDAIEFWDDRAVQVEKNTGRRIDGK